MKPITNERLLEILAEEIKKHGIGFWSDRRNTVEEMLRMRGVKFSYQNEQTKNK